MLSKMPVHRGLMKADLAAPPTCMPEIGLQSLRFPGGIRRRFIARAGRLVRDLVAFIEPRAEIDEPAAITAEGPVGRCRRPLHRSPAGRAFNGRDHRHSRSGPYSRAAS